MIDVRLITFMTLLEEKSYTKTAKKLYITQPAVTHHIKSIEKDYNITLFDSNKQFELTKAGQILLDYAKAGSLHAQLLRNNLDRQRNEKLGVNAAITNDAKKVLYNNNVMKGLFSSDMKIELSVCSYDKILDLLGEGKIDFAIIDNSFDGSIYDSVNIYSTKLILVCDPNGKFAGKERVTREQLISNELLISTEGTGLNTCTMTSLHQKNIKLKDNIPTYFNDIDIMYHQVISNDAIGFVYYDSVSHLLEAKKLKKIELLNFQFSQNIYVIYNKLSNLDEKIITLLNNLESYEAEN
ncbi:MAG: LysR family transcriptional regulator [Acholeplasmatales bacterium]|nr:LysR family transcriptional regulator [Acholeplasmatales bacterium]